MVNTNKVPLRRIDGINNYKTNCITEIPQDIKLELVNGVLTLKAGSNIYIPNGFKEDGVTKNFMKVEIEEDSIYTKVWQGNTSGVLYINIDGTIQFMGIDRLWSGDSEPRVVSLSNLWYDTTNNVMKKTFTSGNEWASDFDSFPIAIITLTYDSASHTNTIVSIDQVFNGFGYIGNTIFALPGVKGLIPNGRNEDGSLNNIEYSQEDVWVYTLGEVSNTMYTFLGKDVDDYNPYFIQDSQPNEKGMWFDTLNNYIKRSTDNGKTWEIRKDFYIGSREVVYGKIISFTPNRVFKEVDQNDFPQLFEDNMKQKIKVVSDLPSNPEVGVLYYVKE